MADGCPQPRLLRLAHVCRQGARSVPGIVGSPWTFIGAVAAVIGWLALGPVFDWSPGWVLWPATVTSMGAFLLVLLLQYSQNRDTRVVQLKLDELLRSVADARTQLIRLEHVPDEELDRIEDEFADVRRRVGG
jgi:low affinity Fe/Cu permease